MRRRTLWCSVLTTIGIPTLLMGQQPSLLRDLPPIQVIVDRLHVPMTEAGADSLSRRVRGHLRAAGVLVTDTKDPPDAPGYALDKPTFLISLNMVPDGCAFVVNLVVRMPLEVRGFQEKMSVSVYASRSYAYSTRWTDHSPVLNFIDDFIEAWRAANTR